MWKYYFKITEKDNTVVQFEGYFNDHIEADDYIRDCEREGAKVVILKPYYEW